MPRGRLEKRIFGNRILPEDRPNQIPAGFVFPGGFQFFHKPLVGGPKALFGIGFRSNAAFGEDNESPADSEVSFLGDAPDLSGERCRNGHTLTYWFSFGLSRVWPRTAGHDDIVSWHAPLWFSDAATTRRLVKRYRARVLNLLWLRELYNTESEPLTLCLVASNVGVVGPDPFGSAF